MAITAKPEITAEVLRGLLHYDAETGVFTRIASRMAPHKVGTHPGIVMAVGYLGISIKNKTFYAHRLAWLYMTGEWPDGKIDHVNGDRTDNRFANLRVVTDGENVQNQRVAHADSITGFLGVGRHTPDLKGNARFRARIQINKRMVSLGVHATPEIAHAAYVAAKRRLHPAGTI